MELMKLKICLNNGQTETFQKKEDNIKSISLNEENGLIKLQYSDNNKWESRLISIHNVASIDYKSKYTETFG